MQNEKDGEGYAAPGVKKALVWRKYHGNGDLCPSAVGRSRPARVARPGERTSVAPCGCPGQLLSYYQADDLSAPIPLRSVNAT